jgi:hypothetical protein
MSSKAELLAHIRKSFGTQHERLLQAARDAHAAATDPDAKAESKYDTRSLEASYLASGQARQLEETTEALRLLEGFQPRDFELDDPIDAGALVELSKDDETEFYLLAPAAGGMSVTHQGREITLLTPSSRLYQAMLGATVGTTLEETGHMVTELE